MLFLEKQYHSPLLLVDSLGLSFLLSPLLSLKKEKKSLIALNVCFSISQKYKREHDLVSQFWFAIYLKERQSVFWKLGGVPFFYFNFSVSPCILLGFTFTSLLKAGQLKSDAIEGNCSTVTDICTIPYCTLVAVAIQR